MTSDEARAILAEGRATLERTADIGTERRSYSAEPDAMEEWRRNMPKPEPAPVQRRTTDAEALRTEQWQRYIDARIAEHVEQALGQHRAASIAWIKASAKAITRDHTEIEKLDLRLSALLQSVEKMQRGFGDDAKIIDLPNPLTRDRSRAG